jgi:hypothetical protein
MSASAASRGEATAARSPRAVRRSLKDSRGGRRRPPASEREGRRGRPGVRRARRPASTSAGRARPAPRRCAPQLAAGRPEALDLEAQPGERRHAAGQPLVLVACRQLVPALVAPAVHPDLVAGRRDVAQRLWIELGVEPLDEEGRPQVQRGERGERARQPDGDRRMRAARRRAVDARGRRPRPGCRSSGGRRRAAPRSRLLAVRDARGRRRRSTWPRTAPCSSSTHPRVRA